MTNNYEALRNEFRGLVEKRTAGILKAGIQTFLKGTGVKTKQRSSKSLIASRVDYKEQRDLLLELLLAELKGVKKGKVKQSMLVAAAKKVQENAKQQAEVASL